MARYSFHDYHPDPDDPNYTPWWQKALVLLVLALVAGLIKRCSTGSW